MIKVLLVDDHQLIRIALASVLTGVQGIQVVGEADSGEAALVEARRLRPDVVLLDVDMPGMGGVEATRRLVALTPAPRVIVLSVHDQAPYPQQLLQAGALGYLPKGGDAAAVIAAIRTVHRGQPYVSPEIAGRLAMATLRGAGDSPLQRLSPRELQIMQLLTSGRSPQAIAEDLHISPKTVFTHRYRIYDKLGVDSDVALTHLAMRHGLVEPG